MTNSTDTLNKQLFQELDDKAAENCNGGKREVFTIKNWAQNVPISYWVDRKQKTIEPGGTRQVWITYKGGIVQFDRDTRSGVAAYVKYNLKGGAVYAFRWNKGTKGNPFDIYLGRIG